MERVMLYSKRPKFWWHSFKIPRVPIACLEMKTTVAIGG